MVRRSAARMAVIVVAALALGASGCCPTASPTASPPVPSSRPLASTAPRGSAGAGAQAPSRCVVRPMQLVESVPVEALALDAGTVPTAEAWRALIERARSSIAIGQFYVSSRTGGRLEPVLEALAQAVARGVRARLLVDQGFGAKYPDALRRLEQAGVEVRRYDVAALTGGVHHAKYLLVDGCEAYVGSANFDWRSLEHIHELGLWLTDQSVVRPLGELFELDWRIAAEGEAAVPRPPAEVEPPTEPARPMVPFTAVPELVASPPPLLPAGAHREIDAILGAIDAARASVLVELLDYQPAFRDGSPFSAIDEALRRAAARGARVRLLLSHWSSGAKKIGAIQDLARVAGIEIRLVTIPEHSSGFIPFARTIHAKYLVVDGEQVWLGSSNWGADYFMASRNVSVVVGSRRLAATLTGIFERLFDGPYAALVEPDRRYPLPRIAE